MVGIAQLVSAPDCGSGGLGFESRYPPFYLNFKKAAIKHFYRNDNIGLSPSGKAQDFDSCIPMVQIHLAQFPINYIGKIPDNPKKHKY